MSFPQWTLSLCFSFLGLRVRIKMIEEFTWGGGISLSTRLSFDWMDANNK